MSGHGGPQAEAVCAAGVKSFCGFQPGTAGVQGAFFFSTYMKLI